MQAFDGHAGADAAFELQAGFGGADAALAEGEFEAGVVLVVHDRDALAEAAAQAVHAAAGAGGGDDGVEVGHG